MFAADRNLCVLGAEFLPTEGNFVYEGQARCTLPACRLADAASKDIYLIATKLSVVDNRSSKKYIFSWRKSTSLVVPSPDPAEPRCGMGICYFA